jgi:hypothetical protein
VTVSQSFSTRSTRLVKSTTGAPFQNTISARSRRTYSDYVPELERARAARDKSLEAVKAESMSRLMQDLAVDRQDPDFAARDRWDPNAEDEEDEDDGGEENIIDRCKCLHTAPRAPTDARDFQPKSAGRGSTLTLRA